MKLLFRVGLLGFVSVLLPFCILYFFDPFNITRTNVSLTLPQSRKQLPMPINASDLHHQNHYKVKISEKVPPIGWQSVTGSNHTFVVLSAHFLKSNKIRVIASTQRFSAERVYCTYSDNIFGMNETSANPVYNKMYRGHVDTMNEHFGLKYSGKFITCPFPEQSELKWKPKYVSIVASSSLDELEVLSTELIGNFLAIRYPPEPESGFAKTDFAVCVKPIYNGYNNTLQFLEWFEFHKLMGVRHFTFFVAEAGEELRCLLNSLQLWASEENNNSTESIVVELLSWANYPFSSGNEVRGGVQGLSEAANECAYRHKGVSKYMAFVDLDEMIVPHVAGVTNYHQFIEVLETRSNIQLRQEHIVGAYIFQNAFFKDDSSNKPSQQEYNKGRSWWWWSWFGFADDDASSFFDLNTVNRTIRQQEVQAHDDRSKYICNPTAIAEAGTHFIWHFNRPFRAIKVGSEFGAVHHYRSNYSGIVDWNTTSTVKDRTAKTFGLKIESSVRTWNEIFKKLCGLKKL